ncbi:hypothetical protein ACEUD0_01865 [Aeromonas veronii]
MKLTGMICTGLCMQRISFFYVYIYIIPALLSLVLIASGGTLLGDFRSYSYSIDPIDFFLTLMQFLLPLAFIFLVIKTGDKLVITKGRGTVFECFLLTLFVFIFLVTFFIGAIKVGSSNVGGLPGLLMSFVFKLNPYLLLGLLAFSNIKAKHFVFCLLVCILYSFKQVSLQGYLVSLFSLVTFILLRKNISNKLFFFVLIVPFFIHSFIFDVLIDIYTLRNQMRGVAFDSSQIMSLAVGRISSLSSYLYIRESLTTSFEGVSDYFSLGIFLERLSGFSVFNTVSPSVVFNKAELGAADYSIFLGLNGFLLALYKSSVLIFMFNVTVLLLVFLIIFQMLPYFDRKARVHMFFLIMYMPILSFDIWEISIVFQSIILINVLFLLYRGAYVFFFKRSLSRI